MDVDGSSLDFEGRISISLTARTDVQRRIESILTSKFIL